MGISALHRNSLSTLENGDDDDDDDKDYNPSGFYNWDDEEDDEPTLSTTDKLAYGILFDADEKLQPLVKLGTWPDMKSVVLSELSNEVDHYLLYHCRLKRSHGLNKEHPNSRTLRIRLGIDATDLWISPEHGVKGACLYLVAPTGPDPVEWFLGAMMKVLTTYQDAIVQHNSREKVDARKAEQMAKRARIMTHGFYKGRDISRVPICYLRKCVGPDSYLAPELRAIARSIILAHGG